MILAERGEISWNSPVLIDGTFFNVAYLQDAVVWNMIYLNNNSMTKYSYDTC